MRTIEIEARTLEEATLLAGKELDCAPEDLDVDILEERSGILGLGRKVKIQATLAKAVADADASPTRENTQGPALWAMNPDFDARQALETICRKIMSEVNVTAREDNGRMVLDIQGDGSGIFIGRKGMTLEALQFTINKMNLKQTGEPRHIIVDSEKYLVRRIENLSHKARHLADKAAQTGQPQVTEPLNAHDRRIIHTTLRDKKGASTRSIGNGEFKRVQITAGR